MATITDSDGWVPVTLPETTDIALGGNETYFPGKFFRELASRDKFVYDRTGRNKIINGNFDIWQRGTEFSLYEYTADRWFNLLGGSSLCTVTRQEFPPGQTEVPGNPIYYYRATVTSGGTASSFAAVQQRIEDVRTFQNQTVTVSFWAKAYSTNSVSVELEQNFGTGDSPSTTVTGIGATKFTLTTSWAKYTATVFVPSITGKTLGSDNNSLLAFNIWFEAGSDYNNTTDTLGLQSGTFDIAKVQVELGSIATTFEELPFSTQLNLCQYYYSNNSVRYFSNNTDAGYLLYGNSVGSLILASLALPVPMRTNPAVIVIDNVSINCTISEAGPHGPGCIFAKGTPVNSANSSLLDLRVAVDAEL